MVGGGIVGVTTADASGNVSTTFPVPGAAERGHVEARQGLRDRRSSRARPRRPTASARRACSATSARATGSPRRCGCASPRSASASRRRPGSRCRRSTCTTSTRRARCAGRSRSARAPRLRHDRQDEAAQAVPVQPAQRQVDAAVRHEPGVPPRHRRQPLPLLHDHADRQLTAGGAAARGRPRARSTSSPSCASDDDRVALGERAVEDPQRERVDEALLDHALQRPGAVDRVVAEVADQRARVVRQLDGDAALGDPRARAARPAGRRSRRSARGRAGRRSTMSSSRLMNSGLNDWRIASS